MNAIKRILLVAAVAAGIPWVGNAGNYSIPKFRINQYYGDNAVLQRGVTLPICGTAQKGATVTVTFNGQTKSTTANIDTSLTASGGEARWVVEFPAIANGGGSYTLTASDGTTTLTKSGLTVGEVWVVSGQSNAQYPIKSFNKQNDVKYTADYTSEWLKDADYPNLHFIIPGENHFEWQLNDNSWVVCSPSTAGDCSAMGFFFAKELLKSMPTQIPVGLVNAATDGSLITEWIPGSTSSKDHYTKTINNYLEPLPPFPVKGVLWYQGESDGMFGFAGDYPARLTTLVTNWREIWNNPTMPFIVVQLPFYGQYGQWCDIRLAQNQVAASVPGVYVMPTLDIGDINIIHPPKKPELGKRLSDYARKYVYGETGVNPEGPILKSWSVNPSNEREILLDFEVNGSIAGTAGQTLKGFQMGGDYFGQKNKYFAATAKIVDGDTIAVTPNESNLTSDPGAGKPFVVRYGCFNMDPTEVDFFDTLGYSARAFSTVGFKASDEPVHLHGWKFTLSGSVLTAVCTNSGCTAGTPTFSIGGASSKVYDGKPLEAVKVGTDFAGLTSSELGLIEYYQNNVKMSGLPVEVGVYEARVSVVDHYNVTHVLKKTLTITEPGETPQTDDPAGAIAATGDATGASDVGVIQAAINAAKPNGTVTLGSGIYYINTQLLVEDGVTLQGQGWDKTIIKQVASGADCRVATVDGGSTIKRMALTGGRVETTGNYKSAGGVALKNGTISWCCITNNLMSAGNSIVGGGIGIYAGKGQIDHSIIADNTVSASGENAVYGGGIGVFQASGVITVDSCLIYGNTSVMTKGHRSGKGGGIGVNGSYNTVNVRNTTIVGNVAGKSDGDNTDQSKGGAVYCDGGTFKLTNCILWGNDTAQNGYDVDFHNTTVALDHCLYATSEYMTDLPGSAKITACATTDPKFTDGYALASDSPAKGTGATYTGIGVDLTGADFANPPSMGCYEFGSVPGVLPDVPGGEDDPQVDPPAVKKCGVGLFID